MQTKPILKSRLVWLSILLAALSAAQLKLPEIQAFISPDMYGWLGMGLSVVVAALRVITNTGVTLK